MEKKNEMDSSKSREIQKHFISIERMQKENAPRYLTLQSMIKRKSK